MENTIKNVYFHIVFFVIIFVVANASNLIAQDYPERDKERGGGYHCGNDYGIPVI